MKKVLFFITIIFFLSLTMNVNAADISLEESNVNITIQVDSQTKELNFKDSNITLNEYEIIYDTTKLHQVNTNLDFYILSPELTNIIIINKTTNKEFIITLNFVTPETVELIKENDIYYVSYNGEKLYGEFNWLVDGVEKFGITTQGNDVSLLYKGNTIKLTTSEAPSKISEYILLGLGCPILLFIIGYIIYILLPTNHYKKIYKLSIKTKNKINKPNMTAKKIIFNLKLSLPTLAKLVDTLDENEPYLTAYKKVSSDLNTMLDNIINVDSFYPEDQVTGLLNYVNRKLDVYIRITNNGTYKLSKDKKVKLPKIEIPSIPNEMDRNQEDSYHYLEGIKVINKKNN